MKGLNNLQFELGLITQNIMRLKDLKEDTACDDYFACNSHLVGELKHRCVAVKQTLTRVNRLNTQDILK